MTRCQKADCIRPPEFEGAAFCDLHRLRWLPGRPVEREPALPEWRKRSLVKDFTRSDAA